MLSLSNDVHPNYPGGFVVMAKRAGMPVIAHIINAAMVIATLSVATGDIYVVVRIPFCQFSLGNRVDAFQLCPRLMIGDIFGVSRTLFQSASNKLKILFRISSE
jgi:hypothetical protein